MLRLQQVAQQDQKPKRSTLKPKVALSAAAEPNTISTAVTMGFRCLALGPRSLSEAVLLLLLLLLLLAWSAADWIASRSLDTAPHAMSRCWYQQISTHCHGQTAMTPDGSELLHLEWLTAAECW